MLFYLHQDGEIDDDDDIDDDDALSDWNLRKIICFLLKRRVLLHCWE